MTDSQESVGMVMGQWGSWLFPLISVPCGPIYSWSQFAQQ